MLASKFLQNSRTLLQRNAFGKTVRECHVVVVPARSKLSFVEKVAYGGLMVVSMWTIPTWVFYHLADYQKENRNEYTGK